MTQHGGEVKRGDVVRSLAIYADRPRASIAVPWTASVRTTATWPAMAAKWSALIVAELANVRIGLNR
jgi:hypothetical protein